MAVVSREGLCYHYAQAGGGGPPKDKRRFVMSARRGRSLRAVLAGSLVFGGLTAVSLGATTALTAGMASASPVTLFSSSTPGTYSATVPAGVTSATITAVGGTGGSVTNEGAGGMGAVVTATVPVVAGQSLSVTVAANGAAGGSGAGNGGSGAGNGGGASAVSSNGTSLVVAGVVAAVVVVASKHTAATISYSTVATPAPTDSHSSLVGLLFAQAAAQVPRPKPVERGAVEEMTVSPL